jgi:hypothetical protein
VSWRVPLAAAVLALLVAAFAFKAAAKMPDFEVYWRAGQRAAAAAPLYRAEDQHNQLRYLPAFAVLAIPAAQVPLPAAKAIWFGLSAALVAVVLALSLALLRERHRSATLLVTVTLVLMAKFFAHELVLGQVNLLLAGCVLTAVHLARRGRSVAAGLLLALAVVIKPYALIMGLWLLARRDVRAIAAAAAGGVAALALPTVVYGYDGTVALHLAWWATVTGSTAPNLLNADNVSLAAMFAKWLGPGGLAARLAGVASVILLLAAVAVCAMRRRVTAPDGLEASLLLTLMPLLSPQGWDYVFLVSTPAVMHLVNYAAQLPAAIRVTTVAALVSIGFSLYDVMGRRLYGQFMAWSIVTVCYLVVIGALVTLRLRRTA